ncbi:uncharacterized protein LOC110091869 isoform X2 [Dendrobium catenatum]|uniref:uncharacterized protein LOC110091869 isoform X2 n=1 Tax=Dendrobium catenatum TaxID=906689 RepID=UPI0009F28C79|nr:uncharacterized protein LOC110091869 isoform X2 [Dendrobium catenatum]XP_028554558.1 uncharacterized protein LOC110091869 isoform X2 [Dendrobium catenatum]
MDDIICAALEEVCVRGASGIRLQELWPSLQVAVSSSCLELSDIVKQVIWGRLASQPGLRFTVSGSSMEHKDVLQGSMEEMERIGLSIVAEEHMRDSFLGLYDLKQSPHFEISQIQRRVLERLAMARSSGVTQSELAKELDIKGTNFSYVVRNLVCQQLIVKQSTMVREKDYVNVENGPKYDQIVNTNLLHLSRYAKNVKLNPQQRIEITRSVFPQMLNESEDTEPCSFPTEVSEDCLKEDVHIKDYIPAMKTICEKLEASKNKVDVVSSIKLALGYRKSSGHRAWRSILYRLKYSGLVEEFQAKVNGKNVSCLRLIKKFDPKYFLPKSFMHGHNGSDSENLVKTGKRGQITDQLVEVPLEHRIYDMIDAEGQKGITILELSKRLGISSKKLHKRVFSMREKFGVVSQSEIQNKQQVYRFWTHSLHHNDPNKCLSDNQNLLLDQNELSTHSGDSIQYQRPFGSNSKGEILVMEKPDSGQELKTHSSFGGPSSELIESEQQPVNRAHEDNFMDSDVIFDEACSALESHVSESTSLHSMPVSSIPILQTQKYACRASTFSAAQREQRILEKLKNEKFLLKVELHKWLGDIEKDKPTTMDRKTLERSLKRLQDLGFCRCIGVHMPSLTNFNSLRYTEAILHPSVNPSQELVQQIYERQRSFDIQSRRFPRSARMKHEQSVVELPELQNARRASIHADGSPASKAMSENGFVIAKMVRVKLLHKFLWSYMSSSPYWQNALCFLRKDGVNVANPAKDCQLFSLDAAIKEMPLELFLQVGGSRLVINNLEKKCKLGLRLSDLSVQERRCLLDTQATSRLSSIVEILLRLRLIQLVKKGTVQDVNLLSHALELKAYLEEPVPAVLPSSDILRSNDCYKLRHDFILSDKEAVELYWETLEYCFASADPSYSRQCFPGSIVEEVFHRRSWSSIRVMTTEQRLELLKHFKTVDHTKKIPFSDCVKISRELNLTLEQVLRVYYDKRQARVTGCCNHLKSEGWGQSQNPNNVGSPRKRRRLLNHACRDHTPNVPAGELNEANERTFSDNDEVMRLDSCSLSAGENVRLYQALRESKLSPAEVQPQSHEEYAETAALISQCAFDKLKPSRKRKFSWTDISDRKLVMQYAKHRAMLGARFARVEWSSLCDLPAQPDTCKRRMATLNQNSNIRRAVLRLCNLLGERYTRCLDNSRVMANQESLKVDDYEKSYEGFKLHDTVLNEKSCVNICNSNSQRYCWDDFEDADIKLALEEVFKYKRLAKKEDAKSVGCRPEEGWINNRLSRDLEFTSSEPEKCSSSSCGGGVLHDVDKKNPVVYSAAAQNRSNNYSSRGKVLMFRGNNGLSQIYKSLSISNAIELIKVVFLSCSKSPRVQNLLARTLQKYPQGDIFAAFSYLREKNYLVVGHGSRPFVLSRKFFHNVSSSPFPNDSGKRATNFSSWLQKQQSDLIKDGVAIAPDLQCGEVAHLFSLVLSGDFSISPRLPNCGIGEADEFKSSESFSSLEDMSNIGVSKKLKRKVDVPRSSEKVKKPKPQSKADGDRREKGFPSIKVFLNMETVLGVDAFECLGHGKDNSHALAGNSTSVETTCSTSSLDNVDVTHDMGRQSCWDAMTGYFELLASASAITNEARPSSTDFKFVHSVICQAGEQGLSMDEVSGALKIKGERVAEMFVDTLEVFQLAVKVNAFDSVRVVDASHTSKYFISVPNHVKIHNQGFDFLSCSKPQGISSGTPGGPFQHQHGNIDNSLVNPGVGVGCENKTRAHDMSDNPCEYRIEVQPFRESAIIAKESESDESFHLQDIAVGSVRNPVAGMAGVFQPILPWINGDGTINMNVYKGLTRRILGIIMQNPCILEEDIITKMDVLNPQKAIGNYGSGQSHNGEMGASNCHFISSTGNFAEPFHFKFEEAILKTAKALLR